MCEIRLFRGGNLTGGQILAYFANLRSVAAPTLWWGLVIAACTTLVTAILRQARFGAVTVALLLTNGQPRALDEQTFYSFYSGTARALRVYVARASGELNQADDIVQESYLRLLRMPAASDDPQQLRPLLFRIASHLMTDRWRRRRRATSGADAHGLEPHASTPDMVLRLDMIRGFQQLKPQQRQMMWLAYVEGADHREIASALGLREGSGRVLLHRARRKLASLPQVVKPRSPHD